MVEIGTLFQTKTAEKTYPFAPHIQYPYSLYKGLLASTPRGEKRVAGDESRCLRKRD